MTASEIKPALTEEEWARAFAADRSGKRNPRELDGVFEMADTPESQHYIAALALHGQPFGFTHDDVRQLKRGEWWMDSEARDGGDIAEQEAYDRWKESLVARIASLLPPEET